MPSLVSYFIPSALFVHSTTFKFYPNSLMKASHIYVGIFNTHQVNQDTLTISHNWLLCLLCLASESGNTLTLFCPPFSAMYFVTKKCSLDKLLLFFSFTFSNNLESFSNDSQEILQLMSSMTFLNTKSQNLFSDLHLSLSSHFFSVLTISPFET